MSMKFLSVIAVFALPAAVAGCSARQPATVGSAALVSRGSDAAPAPVDYGDPATWLCLPGRDDACTVDLNATTIEPDGTMLLQQWRPDPTPPIDCFYVYPTVSREPAANSGIVPTAAEQAVVASQFARFGSQCRTFAPMYRQVTLAAIRAEVETGVGPGEADPWEIAYGDVRDAWNAYLEGYNNGRGVVLIGHSQGSAMLLRLVQEEIEGTYLQPRLVSAILPGWNVLVPEERDVGGDFELIPLCRAPSQIGCLVSYVSFSEDAPPPSNSLFGRSAVSGYRAACTNPAALRGGRAGLDPYLSANRSGLEPWVQSGPEITTPYVRAPGLVQAECVLDAHGSYLAVRVVDLPGPRSTVIGGTVMNADGTPNTRWGLHLLDMPLGIGDLVDLVGNQARAFQSRPR